MARITLRLSDDLHQRIEAASRQSGVSLNQLIVSTLRAACENNRLEYRDADPLVERVKHLRLIMGDLVEEIDPDELPADISEVELQPIEEFRRALPVLDPPLSVTIAQEREDRL